MNRDNDAAGESSREAAARDPPANEKPVDVEAGHGRHSEKMGGGAPAPAAMFGYLPSLMPPPPPLEMSTMDDDLMFDDSPYGSADRRLSSTADEDDRTHLLESSGSRQPKPASAAASRRGSPRSSPSPQSPFVAEAVRPQPRTQNSTNTLFRRLWRRREPVTNASTTTRRARSTRRYETPCQYIRRNPEQCMFLPAVFFAILVFTFVVYQIRVLSKEGPQCNGQSAYCAMRYNSLTQIVPFRSYAVGEHLLATQEVSIAAQLDGGARALYLDVAWRDPHAKDVLDMCESKCLYMDGGRLLDAANTVKAFLDDNHNEVVTLLLKTHADVSASDVAAVLRQSGMVPYAYAQTLGKALWPTLQEMIDANKRVVVFIDTDVDYSRWPWLLREYDFVWESSLVYSADAVNLSDPGQACAMVLPKDTPRSLSLFSHVVFSPAEIDDVNGTYPNRTFAAAVNDRDSLVAHGQLCEAYLAERVDAALGVEFVPNFITVAFTSRGQPYQAARILNMGEADSFLGS